MIKATFEQGWNNKIKPLVIICCDAGQLGMLSNFIYDGQIQYIVYMRNLETQTLFKRNEILNRHNNVSFTDDENIIYLKLPHAHQFISFRTLVHIGHLPFLKFCLIAKSAKIPVIEVQHGLFQNSINYYSCSDYIEYKDSYYLPAGITYSIADKQILWEEIGFPLSPPTAETLSHGGGRQTFSNNENGGIFNKSKPDENIPHTEKSYILIASNTNWYLYEPEQEVLFYKTIFEVANHFPDELFIWKPHPAEIQPLKKIINIDKPDNLLLYGIDLDVVFSGKHDLIDIIADAKFAIATIGTSLLELQLMKTPTLLFDNPNCKALTEQISGVGLFKNGDDLIPLVQGLLNNEVSDPIKLGFHIPPFNKEKLHQILKENIRTDYSTIDEAIREAYYIVNSNSNSDSQGSSLQSLEQKNNHLQKSIDNLRRAHDRAVALKDEARKAHDRAVALKDEARNNYNKAIIQRDKALKQLNNKVNRFYIIKSLFSKKRRESLRKIQGEL